MDTAFKIGGGGGAGENPMFITGNTSTGTDLAFIMGDVEPNVYQIGDFC